MAKHRLEDRITPETARPAPRHRRQSERSFRFSMPFDIKDYLPSKQTVGRVSRFIGKTAVAAGIVGGIFYGADKIHDGLTVEKSNVLAQADQGNVAHVGKSQAELSNEQIAEALGEAVQEGQEAFWDTSIGVGSISASSLASAAIFLSRRRRLEGVTEEDRAFEAMFGPVLDPVEEVDLTTQLLGAHEVPDIDFEAELLELDQQFAGANA